MSKSTSILLGAGFSAQMGYPIGNTLNDLILNCKGDDFAFHTNGQLVSNENGEKPNFGYKNNFDHQFDFCKLLIGHFNSLKGYFDYEEFYDYIQEEAINDKKAEELAKPFKHDYSFDQLLKSLNNIYAQLVSHYLKDGNGKIYYDDEGYMLGPIFPGYTGILNCFAKLAENGIVNVHTLNHDLFFERLNTTEWLKGELCDGFEELGSKYYGNLKVDGRTYKVRLERYTGKYDKIFRLYKLHGSLDYGVYYKSDGANLSPEVYVKKRYGIGFGELFKEIDTGGSKLEYERCWINYHADFLTGTSSKISRYSEPLLYKSLFAQFEKNLKDADILLIIGYGGKDSEINRLLKANFNFAEKQCFIIDPFPSIQIYQLSSDLNGTIVKKFLDQVTLTDIGIH